MKIGDRVKSPGGSIVGTVGGVYDTRAGAPDYTEPGQSVPWMTPDAEVVIDTNEGEWFTSFAAIRRWSTVEDA